MKMPECPRLIIRSANSTEPLQIVGGRQPFLADGEYDKLLGHQSETQQQREGDKRGKAHHLPQYGELSLLIISHTHKHRLVHLFHHPLNQ